MSGSMQAPGAGFIDRVVEVLADIGTESVVAPFLLAGGLAFVVSVVVTRVWPSG